MKVFRFGDAVKNAALTCAVLLFPAQGLHAFDIQNDLQRLDAAVASSAEYEAKKLDVISSLEDMIVSDKIDDAQRRNLLYLLYEEYYTYSFPKANAALNRLESITSARDISMGGGRVINDVHISRAKVLSAAGMFLEARDILERSIDTLDLSLEQKQRYFAVAQKSFWGYREYAENLIDRKDIEEKIELFSRCVEACHDTTSVEFREIQVTTLIAQNHFEKAEAICDLLIGSSGPSSHVYGIFCYYKATINQYSGRIEEAIHWYAESAINDFRFAVKENASLYSLAKILLSRGDVERAFRYTNIALSDALVYDSRLRPFQIVQSLPDIQSAYQLEQKRQEHRTYVFIWLMALFAAMLLVAVVFMIVVIYRRHKTHLQIQRMGEELKQMVQSLSEANAAKEEYLGLFLSMCSGYLDKMKKNLSMAQFDEELKNFYTTFDQAFLHLYPNFVADFNALLRPEEQIELKKHELLNTELRIFALIRLGITQSSHIASLLRYSVNTIYNYRAQIKKASIGDPDRFEDRVKTL